MPDDLATYWDYFGRIYCISLQDRKDRREQAKAQFRAVGLADRVEFVLVKRHPVDIEQGIYESHLLCMGKGIRAGACNILIFEDDILFDRFSPRTLGDCVDFLSTNPDWKVMFLGCMVKGSEKTENRSVLRVRFMCACHAYVITRHFAQDLVKIPWKGVPFDDMLRHMKERHMYAVYPAFAFQSSASSDNEKFLPLDRFRRICGGFRRVQKMNEFYHHNKAFVISAHAVAALILILMLTL